MADEPVVLLRLSLTDLRDIAKSLDHRLDALADAGTYRGHALRPAVLQTRERVAALAAQISLHIKNAEERRG